MQMRTRHLSAVRAVWSALSTQCTVNLEHSNALSTQCTRSNGHSALSATHLIGTECSVRASCVVPCAREPRRPPWASLSLSLPLTRALPRLDLPVSVLACDVRQPIENLRARTGIQLFHGTTQKKNSMETAASTVMDRYVEMVKQWPGQQQVNLAVEIQVPGSWFGVGPMGCLTATERREKYTAQAVEYCEVREFPGATKGARKIKEKAIRFICLADAADAPNSEGYWMQLSQWNRFRNDTFKDVQGSAPHLR